MQSKIIELKNFSTFTPSGQSLVQNLNLTLRSAEILLIEGENGTGKTTLVRALLGLYTYFSGEMSNHAGPDNSAYLAQMGNIRFFLPLTLQDVIQLKTNSSQEQILALGLLSRASLERPWNTASGGERQKALVSRILLGHPKLAVFDEPFNHMDETARAAATKGIEALAHSGSAVILISHLGTEKALSISQRLSLTSIGIDS